MERNNYEKSLKRWLKRRVKITLGLMVAFMITGTVGFADDDVAEGTIEWHKLQAEKYLGGIDPNTKINEITGNNFSVKDNTITISDTTITVDGNKISTKTLENLNSAGALLNSVYNDGTSPETVANDILREDGSSNYNYGLNTTDDTVVVNNGTSEMEQNIIRGEAYNYGTLSGAGYQRIRTNGIGYNYGVISRSGGYGGQRVDGLNGKAYNYGLIANVSYGQYSVGTNAELYNYGIIANKKLGGQITNADNSLTYNYGLIANTGNYGQAVIFENNRAVTNAVINNYGIIMNSGDSGQFLQWGGRINPNNYISDNLTAYNYGVIANTGNYGQNVESKNSTAYNYGIIENNGEGGQRLNKAPNGDIENSKIINYGTIENKGNKGQTVSGLTEKNGAGAYNYGLIVNTGDYGQYLNGAGEIHNFGLIHNTKDYAIGIENSKGENSTAVNYGVVINDTGKVFTDGVDNKGIVITNKENINDVELGNGTNSGVVLGNNYILLNSDDITELTGGELNIEDDKTYYSKNNTTEFSKNILNNNHLTTVIAEESKTAYKYIGAEEELILENSGIIGYFEKSGTLLELGEETDLTLINSVISGVSENQNTNVTAVNLNGGTLTVIGDSQIAGTVAGRGGVGYVAKTGSDSFDVIGDVTLKNDNDGNYGMADRYTNIEFGKAKADNLILDFAVENSENINRVILNNAELNSINGSSSTEKIELTIIDSLENIDEITLGQNDDILNIRSSTTDSENIFNYKVNSAETINLNGRDWHIGENAKITGGSTTLHIAENSQLHVDMNNNYGAGNVTTSLDEIIDDVKLSVTTVKDQETEEFINSSNVRFTVGDKFDVNEKQFNVKGNYDLSGANLGAVTIFKGTGEDGTVVTNEDGSVTLVVKEASELGLRNYKALYDTVIGNLSENEELREAVNHGDFVGKIEEAGETAEALYTTGYAVTKDVADTYISVVEDFGRKAGAGEWLAYGKYINSDTEFDGGNKSKGYDGDIIGTVGMLEYGVNDTTSYGVIYGQGDTEVDINGGGKLDGDNRYIGGYVKHRTAGGIDLVGNIGYTKSELDLSFASNVTAGEKDYHIITDGNSDASALTFGLKGKKDYEIYDGLKLQPVAGIRYTLITQDEVTSSDASYRMDEQDVTVFEGSLGANLVKEFNLNSGKLAFSVGAEYVLTEVNKSDSARFTLYNQAIELTGEDDIADNRIEAHVGAEYIHENGIGFEAKYESIFTDKGDSSRITAGVSYKF